MKKSTGSFLFLFYMVEKVMNNDADFEIELEELLESDIDECNGNKTQKENMGAGRRPETRQNRRQKDSAQYKKKLSGQANRPLRPLLPVLPNGPIVPFSTNDGKTLMPDYFTAEDGFIKGFTPHQIGQLHCLIHEHLQLLVQVFSLCVLDSSRQHVASQMEQRNYEIAIEVSQLEATMNGLREEVAKKASEKTIAGKDGKISEIERETMEKLNKVENEASELRQIVSEYDDKLRESSSR